MPSQPEVKVTPWPGPGPATEAAIHRVLSLERLSAYSWSNGPHDRYAPHSHSYHKVIFVVSGSITFGLPELGREAHLSAGDRLDLPAGVRRDALVGPQGVVCLEAHVP